MKTSDIVIGETYALAENYDWKGGYRGHDDQRATKVEVMEKGIEQKGHYGHYGASNTTKSGVRVIVLESPLNAMRNETGTILVRRSAEVRELWSTYETRALAARTARQAHSEEQDAKANRLIEEITMALPEGFIIPEGALPHQRHGSWTFTANLTFDQLAALLEAAATNALNQTREGTT